MVLVGVSVVIAFKGGQAVAGGGLGTSMDAMVFGCGSLFASVAAVWLSRGWPLPAAVLAFAPFLWLLMDDRWLLWWFLAQFTVTVLVSLRSWLMGLVPAAAMLGSLVLQLAGASVLVVEPAVVYSQRSWQVVLAGDDRGWWVLQVVSTLVALLVPAAVGILVRTGVAERVLAVRESAVAAEAQVQAERARLAHDLHDVVAHHVSLIAVRAETAPYTDPDLNATSRRVLAEVAEEARRALEELRGVLGVLHRSEADPDLSPQPGLADVPDLVARAVDAGDDVVAVGIDSEWAVPQTVGYVVYRVVQEGLTNARRHAYGAGVRVQLTNEEGVLVVSVRNGPGRRRNSESRHGEGLAGMSERVRAVGGVLSTDPDPGGGFSIVARFPVGQEGR